MSANVHPKSVVAEHRSGNHPARMPSGPLLKEFQKAYIPGIKKGIGSIIMVTLAFPTEDEIPQLVKAVVWKATQNDLHSDLIVVHVHGTLVDYDAANDNVLHTKAKQMIGTFRGIFKSTAATLFPVTHKVHLVPPKMLSLVEQDLGELGLEHDAACTSRQEWAMTAIDSTLQTTPLLHELSQQNQGTITGAYESGGLIPAILNAVYFQRPSGLGRVCPDLFMDGIPNEGMAVAAMAALCSAEEFASDC
ncbi:uncharacterized protein C8Q71DRAFT_887797 [Rhodofomes roseus]|uniref:DUF6532 domain-containing protein n=1 Tax=Rhodofomes roseus TaxID=34475 RepID=A0ABQ8JZW3_9APHY|nr:uncharacterized protein C8Q71DRAFT_887797 [Rhodofomes roseus]KAH9829625.1 hypothetical protein C8Q71DRAFT_887797 [Rhodofomes roseus]